jgi:hypothetical protein
LIGGVGAGANESIPATVAWMSWYARKLNRHGIEIPVVVCVVSSTQPTTNIRAHDSLW